MKKALSLIISLLIAASFVLTSCNNDIDSESGSPSFEESNTSVEEVSTPVEDESSEVVMTPDENAKKIWQDSFADADAGINGNGQPVKLLHQLYLRITKHVGVIPVVVAVVAARHDKRNSRTAVDYVLH